MLNKTIQEILQALLQGKVVSLPTFTSMLEKHGFKVYSPSTKDIMESINNIKELSQFEMDIKFEVSNLGHAREWTENSELIILEISDIRSTLVNLSYQQYKNTKEWILSDNIEVLQKDITKISLNELEYETMYSGTFLVTILSDTEGRNTYADGITLECKHYEVAKFK